MNCKKKKVFFSRKNSVSLHCYNAKVEEFLFIKKIYKTAGDAEKEYANLGKIVSLSIPAPKILACDGNALYLEYLQGIIFTDILEYNLLPAKIWTSALARWFWNLHSSTRDKYGRVILKYDCNLRNFLYANNMVYGLDFEDSVRGYPVEDIGQVCAYILANRPAFSRTRLAEVTLFVQNYCLYDQSLDLKKVESYIIDELIKMADRKKEQKPIIMDFISSLADPEKKQMLNDNRFTLL